MSKLDESWNLIFERGSLQEKIDRDGFVLISPKELKQWGDKHEPRLLAKLDNAESRPELFKNNHLSILSLQNDLYIIFKDDNLKTYYTLEQLFPKIDSEIYHPVRNFCEYQTLNLSEISSESQAIDFAYIISLIKTFTNEKELFLTIRGRQRSEDFIFKLPANNHPVRVSGVQIEVDAGFESPNKIYIIEAKIGRVNNFNIRQLFYPYKDWSLKSTKEIIPIFFVYTNGLFYFIQFKFGEQYGDLEVIKSTCYTIDEAQKQQVNLGELIVSSMVGSEPDVPYPQANDLDKIIDLVINNKQGLVDKTTISEFFDFDERQGDYYANAAIYLGLLARKTDSSEFILTKEGQYLSTLKNRNKRNYFLLQQMLKRPTFNEAILSVYNNHNKIDKLNSDSVAHIIQKHVNISATTAKRRASTVMNWIRWINSNIEFK